MASRTARNQQTAEVPAEVPAEETAEVTVEETAEVTAEAPTEATAEATAEGTAEVPADAAKAAEVPFNWDAIPEAEEATYTRGPSTIDVEKETPARIKADLQKSFDKYDPNANGGKGQIFWLMLTLPNADAATQYVKLAKRYCTFKEWTFRGGPSASAAEKIRFCAKPKEHRQRPSF